MSEPSLRMTLFQRYTQLQMWLLSRIVWYTAITYLVTLVLFALLRLFTGISVKRVGYFNLRHIILTPRQGVEVRIGKLGISPHRPTVARPGFLTFVVSNLEIIVNPKAIVESKAHAKPSDAPKSATDAQAESEKADAESKSTFDACYEDYLSGSDGSSKFAGVPLFPKRSGKVFKWVRWLLTTVRVFDVQLHSVSVALTDITTLVLTSINLKLDLRKTKNFNMSNFVGTLDNYKLNEGELPITARLSVTDAYTADSLEDETPWQIFEDLRFDLTGVLNLNEMRAKELGLQIHLGRLQLDISTLMELVAKNKRMKATMNTPLESERNSPSQPNLNPPGTASTAKQHMEKKLLRAAVVILHLVHKVQLTAGILEILKVPVDTAHFAASMKDVNLDLSRMNPLSSGFKLLYAKGDTAHQAILSVASVTGSIDMGDAQEEILYVPLITSLTRGNLFSQTLRFLQEDKEKNDSKIKSHLMLHAPNLSIEEHQFHTLVRVALRSDSKAKKAEESSPSSSGAESSPSSSESSSVYPRVPFQNILPQVDLDLTVIDPTLRIICAPSESCRDSMFVVFSNRLHMALSSTHDTETDSYSGVAVFETSGDSAYYHSLEAHRVDVVSSQSTHLTVKASTKPRFHIDIEGRQSDLRFKALRHEIFCAVGQLHAAVRRPIAAWRAQHHTVHASRPKPKSDPALKGTVLRKVPYWLNSVAYRANNLSLSIATNKFRGQTNEILGIKFKTRELAVGYEANVSPEDLGDPKKFGVEIASDGRRLQVTGEDFVLYKADSNVLAQQEDGLSSQYAVAQLPKLGIRVRTHNARSETIEVNIEPRLRIDLNINLILAFSVVREILDLALLRHKKEGGTAEAPDSRVSQPGEVHEVSETPSEEANRIERPSSRAANGHAAQGEHANLDAANGQAANGKGVNRDASSLPESKPEHIGVLHNIILTMPRALIKIDMPSDDQIMFDLGSTKAYKIGTNDPVLHTKSVHLYSQHPFQRTSWCIIASLVKVHAEVNMKARPRVDDKIKLNLDGFRINVPYQFKLYRIIDNGITLAKAIKTLIVQTKERDNDVVLDPKEIKGVPNIPRVRLKTQQLLLSLEDEYFESDLTLIMLTQRNIGDIRRRKMYSLDSRIKSMIRKGLKLIETGEYSHNSTPTPAPGPRNTMNPSRSNGPSGTQTPSGSQNATNAQSQASLHGPSASHSPSGSDVPSGSAPSESQEGPSSSDIEDKMKDRFGHAANNIRHKATNVFTDHIHHKNTRIATPGSESHDNDASLANSLRGVPRWKIHKLLNTGIELGAPADDGDRAMMEYHIWLDLWASPDFKEFRKQRIPLQDGSLGKLTIAEARLSLLQDFSRMWIDTIRHERKIQHLGARMRQTQVCNDELSPETCAEESIIGFSQKPLLMAVDIRQLDLTIDKTTHDTVDTLHKFLYDLGKGQPMDSAFSILVPLWMDLRAHGGMRVDVRDYPLPVLHFPGLGRSQDPKANLALQVKGDLCITEQLFNAGGRNVRRLFVPLRPLPKEKRKVRGSDVIEVHRTLTPIKTFTNLKFHVGSTIPTRVCWCMAYKAGFHGVGESFSGFSKPPVDPSPSLGFWDKIRLVLHARFDFDLPKSALWLCLKAGKSPYDLLNDSSGFVFSWKDNVRVEINRDDNPRSLFLIHSDVFELLVPNYLEWESEFLHATPAERSMVRTNVPERVAPPDKTVFSFGQRTVWKLGMMFQRNSDRIERLKSKTGIHAEHRDSNFRPHYDINLSMPEFIDDVQSYDAYAGFRSDYIHMAISVVSRPTGGPDLGTGEANFMYTDVNNEGENKCAAHLTLGVLNHFKQWKNQFNSVQWPPIKTGSLFPDPVRIRPSNKTFGTALSTAEYQIALSPLDLSFFHQMRHHAAAESHDRCTGLKAKVDDFVFDWHTRREPPKVMGEDGKETVELDGHRRWRMKSHLGEVRLSSVQMCAIDAKLRTQSSRAALKALHVDDLSDSDDDDTSETTSTDGKSSFSGSGGQSSAWGSKYTSHHFGPKYVGDDYWIDLDDYTEIGKWRNLRNKSPEVKVLPFMQTPQFYYLRSDDFTGRAVYVDPKSDRRFPKFGDIVVHDCLMTSNQPERVQAELLDIRRGHLKQHISDFKDSLESLEEQHNLSRDMKKRMDDLKGLIAIGESNSELLHEEMMNFYNVAEELDRKEKEMLRMKNKDFEIQMQVNFKDEGEDTGPLEDPEWAAAHDNTQTELDGDYSRFTNRYIIHAMHLKWNNSVRNLVYRLQTSLSEDKELNYVRCRPAVQYLEELVAKAEAMARTDEPDEDEKEPHKDQEKSGDTLDILQHPTHIKSKLLRQSNGKQNGSDQSDSGKKTGTVGSGIEEDSKATRIDTRALNDEPGTRLQNLFEDLRSVKESEVARKAHSVTFLSPRIQLIAEENPSKCLQMTAKDVEVQVVDTYSKNDTADDNSSQIERRFGVLLNQSGFFVIGEEDIEQAGIQSLCLEQYSGEQEHSNVLWPPWIAIEMCYSSKSLQQFLVVEDISFGVRFDKPNDLHVSSENEAEEVEDVDMEMPSEKENSEMSAEAYRVATHKADNAKAKSTLQGSGDESGNDHDNETGIPGISKHLSKTLKHHGKHKGTKAILTSLVIDAPQLVINMDAVQFYAVYAIAMDLLTYRDPLTKKRQQAIDRMFLSNDFKGDYRGTLLHIELLQKDIRGIIMLRQQLLILNKNQTEASREAKIHLIKLEREAIRRMTQLTVIIRAFKAILRKNMNTGVEKLSKLSLLTNSILLRMLNEAGAPIIELYIRQVHYSKLSNSDNGSLNRATLKGLYARNLLENSTYPMMLANYESDAFKNKSSESIKLKWTRLDRVGGIPILDNAEVQLKPLHIQLEHGVFEKILDFAFPINNRNNNKNGKGEDDESDILRSDSEDEDGLSDDSESDDGDGKPRQKKGNKIFRRLRGSKNSPSYDDGVAEMMNRASNYWSIRSLKILPTQLTVSYKGNSRLSLMNLQNLEIPFPLFELHNKTWTKLELIMRIRKLAIKILLAQSGSIIHNKFKRHKSHTAEDDRDLNLARLQTNGSRKDSKSDLKSELKSELDALSRSSGRRTSTVFAPLPGAMADQEEIERTEKRLLIPEHRRIALEDPEHARQMLREAITGEQQKSGASTKNSQRSSFQSQRNSEHRADQRAASTNRLRASNRDAPGSPSRLRQPDNEIRSVSETQKKRLSRPSFIDKIKKGFN